jgi:glycosyltransferase involved in cell wall biosynthesis
MRLLKIALVHDWVTGFRGGERVLDHLAHRYPEADLFTLLHIPGRSTEAIDALRVTSSPIGRIPGAERHYRKLLPLFPWAIRRFDLRGYDLVISTSHAVAKSVRIPRGTAHLSYCFTPMRYIWDQSDAYLGRGLKRWAASPLIAALRRFDVATSNAAHVTRFVAISNEVAGRIQRHYGRDASVVAPPVDLSWIETASDPAEDFYLLVSGFVPYKQDALAVDTFRDLRRRLVVVGDGPGRAALQRSAPPNVEFTGHVDEARLASLYQRCRALVYPQREDFGLIAVEAQAAGRPVIAYSAGGSLDSIRPLPEAEASSSLAYEDAPTGVFFERPDSTALALAIERFEKAEARFDAKRIRLWAERFSPSHFDAAFDREVAMCMEAVS